MNTDERTARTGSRRLILGTPGRILTAATICVALAACQDRPSPVTTSQPSRSDPAPGTVASSPQPASPAPSRESVYQATAKPCELVDHQLLTRTFGPDSDDVTPPQSTRNNILTTMACNRSYGRDTGATLIAARVELADPAAIEAQYQGLRAVQQKRTPLTEIPGLGQGAYSYIDQDTGAQLALYDGNAYLTVSAKSIAGSAIPPAQTVPVMTQTAQHMLAKLSNRR